MEELDPLLFTERGTARAAYTPLIDLDPHTYNNNHNPVDTLVQHTSDGNDQHSSCDVHGDCAASHSSFMGAPTVPPSNVHSAR